MTSRSPRSFARPFPFYAFFGRLLRTRMTPPALALLVVMVLAAIFADVITPYDPISHQVYSEANQGPSTAHWFGTDYIGRDTLSRVILGSRVSLSVGLVSVGIGLIFGVTIGVIAGFYRHKTDAVLMRISDAIWAFPSIVLALVITSVLGRGLTNVMIAIGIVTIPFYARLARASTLSVRQMEYATAARAVGATDRRIMMVHVLPNIAAPIIVQASLSYAIAITTEAALSFLGVGIQPPTPSWGLDLRYGYQYLEINPSLSVFSGLAIFVTVLSLNFLGDGLRTALDPRLWQRGQG